MITKKIIKVPIYDYKITIIVSDTFEEANKLYPEMHQCNACVLESPTESVIVIPPNQLGTLAHECVHLKNNIWTYIGYKPTSDNDEVDADIDVEEDIDIDPFTLDGFHEELDLDDFVNDEH